MNPLKSIDRLKKGNISEQTSSLSELMEFSILMIEQALKELKTSKAPALLAEKIFDFGTLAVKSIEKAFADDSPREIREILAALLVQLGSKTGINLLLDTAKRPGENQLLAVISLAKANIQESYDAIVEGLRNYGPEFYMKRQNAPLVQTFLTALQDLKHPLPKDLKDNLTAARVPDEIRKFIA